MDGTQSPFSAEGITQMQFVLLTLRTLPVNDETAKALANPDVVSYDSIEELFRDLDSDD